MRLQISWSLIKIASVLKKDENYYPQVILKEYKYTQKEKAIIRYFANDIKYCSDDSDEMIPMSLIKKKLKSSIIMGLFFNKGKFICAKTFYRSFISQTGG